MGTQSVDAVCRMSDVFVVSRGGFSRDTTGPRAEAAEAVLESVEKDCGVFKLSVCRLFLRISVRHST